MLQIQLVACATLAAQPFWAPAHTVTGREPNVFLRDGYPNLKGEIATLFNKTLEAESILTLWDGSKRTALEHMDWLLGALKPMLEDDCPGYGPAPGLLESAGVAGMLQSVGIYSPPTVTELDGVIYEIHKEMTDKGNGAGYFRLRAEIDTSPELFTAMMMEAKILGELDHTVRCLDYIAAYPDGATWLSYWRASPAAVFKDVDGLDLTGYRRDADGTLFQISVSVPDEIAHSSADRGHDMYWGYKLVPLEGGKRTKLSLICQTDLKNIIPFAAANMKIGEVLADYVRSVEKKSKEMVRFGTANALMAKFGLAISSSDGEGDGNADAVEEVKEKDEGQDQAAAAAAAAAEDECEPQVDEDKELAAAAESAQDASESAQDASESAQDASESAQDASAVEAEAETAAAAAEPETDDSTEQEQNRLGKFAREEEPEPAPALAAVREPEAAAAAADAAAAAADAAAAAADADADAEPELKKRHVESVDVATGKITYSDIDPLEILQNYEDYGGVKQKKGIDGDDGAAAQEEGEILLPQSVEDEIAERERLVAAAAAEIAAAEKAELRRAKEAVEDAAFKAEVKAEQIAIANEKVAALRKMKDEEEHEEKMFAEKVAGELLQTKWEMNERAKDWDARRKGGDYRRAPLSCGQHEALDCVECPRGHGAEWCNGDCKWYGTAKTGNCYPAKAPKVAMPTPGKPEEARTRVEL